MSGGEGCAASNLAVAPASVAADPTYRLPNAANLQRRYQPQAAFRFAVPGPQVRRAHALLMPPPPAVAVCGLVDRSQRHWPRRHQRGCVPMQQQGRMPG